MGEVVHILRRRWPIVVIGTLLGAASAFLYSLSITTEFTATTQILVTVKPDSGSAADLYSAHNYARAVLPTYTKLAQSDVVVEPVIDRLGLKDSRRDVAASISANNPANTTLIDISATRPTARDAAELSEAIAQDLNAAVQTYIVTGSEIQGDSTALNLTVVRRPQLPAQPSGPRPIQITAFGAIAGLVIGAGIAWALSRAADRRGSRGYREEDAGQR